MVSELAVDDRLRSAHLPARNQQYAARAVRVGTYDGTLYTAKLNGGGENQSLVIPLGDTVVIASTAHTVGQAPGIELNPLTDADAFLAVMQNLRPYPE